MKSSMKQEWSKAYMYRPRDNLTSHLFISEKKRFRPSYENDDCPIPMSWLIGWEYSRIWIRERDAFIQARILKTKPKHIKNDYHKWLEKRFGGKPCKTH